VWMKIPALEGGARRENYRQKKRHSAEPKKRKTRFFVGERGPPEKNCPFPIKEKILAVGEKRKKRLREKTKEGGNLSQGGGGTVTKKRKDYT